MAYKSLSLDKATPQRVRDLILRVEKSSFSDVHSMLRLPLKNVVLGAGCNYAIAQVLMAVIGGVSATLYEPNLKNQDRAKFTGVLADYYPWNQEPSGLNPGKTADAIYSMFRNPLTHDLTATLMNRVPKYFIMDGNPKTIIQAPLQGYSTKPVFDDWNQEHHAQILCQITGVPVTKLFCPPDQVWTWLKKPDGSNNRMRVKKSSRPATE